MPRSFAFFAFSRFFRGFYKNRFPTQNTVKTPKKGSFLRFQISRFGTQILYQKRLDFQHRMTVKVNSKIMRNLQIGKHSKRRLFQPFSDLESDFRTFRVSTVAHRRVNYETTHFIESDLRTSNRTSGPRIRSRIRPPDPKF